MKTKDQYEDSYYRIEFDDGSSVTRWWTADEADFYMKIYRKRDNILSKTLEILGKNVNGIVRIND